MTDLAERIDTRTAELLECGFNWARVEIAGLEYDVYADIDRQAWMRYRPIDDTITVDGIQYRRNGCVAGAMISAVLDCGYSGARMRCSDPPSEDELDRWVRYGPDADVDILDEF